MAKTCNPVALISIDDDETSKKQMRLAPIFLPQKRLSTTPVEKRHKKRKTSAAKSKPQIRVPSPPPEKTAVLLSSDDETIIDPFEVETDPESSDPLVEPVVGATREEEAENNLWAEKRRPTNTSEMVGHTSVLEKLKAFLNNFSTCRNVQDQYDIDEDEVANLQTGTDETAEAECAIVSGKSGIGKTAIVYAAAGDLGMKVFESNASSRRTGKILMESLQEATQSHHLRGQAAVTAAPAHSIASFFKPKTADAPPAAPISHISSNSVILLDDVDLILDDEELDDGFWRSLKCFIRESKVPVILTATDFIQNILENNLDDMRLVVLRLTNPPLNRLTRHLLNICSEELEEAVDVDSPDNESRMEGLIMALDFDVRKCLNHLQFLGELFFEKPIAETTVSQHLQMTHLKQDQEGGCVANYFRTDSFTDDFYDEAIASKLAMQLQIKRSFFSMTEPAYESIEAMLEARSWSENYQQLCHRISSSCSSGNSGRPSDLTLDILPYISLVCSAESLKASVEEPELLRTRRQSRKRFLHYFDAIGLNIEPGDRAKCCHIYDSFADAAPFDEDISELLPEKSAALSTSVLCLGTNCLDSDTDSSDS